MSRPRSVALAACIVLAALASARADDAPAPLSLQNIDDIIYKGVIGKALDAVPMDPDHRLTLQRANAVVGNTIAGRSLSVWAGLTNPVLLIGGLVWGLFAASNIKPEPLNVLAKKAKPPERTETEQSLMVLTPEGLSLERELPTDITIRPGS